ncbi:cytochrome d ubiquinol oxidase subunit II [Thermithiobacillus plumbiphilus]|uniref:Cytochrome d ubiquinol oxidase subunit II n=1 Tax=Thermithiobacillus plumbiphilus TaxID=1729899 RepID=A0ABU9D5W2_9PROT
MDNTQLIGQVAVIWFLLLGFFLVAYVVLDGFDLGVGILSLLPSEKTRVGIMMQSLGTVWDANESWLVVVGGILFGAFPLAYGMMLPAVYVPAFLLLFGFALRGVAFEYREHAENKRMWEWAFGIGSLLAAAAQGLILGEIIAGFNIDPGESQASLLAWLDPFTLIVSVGVITGYALLGAGYLIMKTEGEPQAAFYRLAYKIMPYPMLVAAAVTIYTPLVHTYVMARWFTLPNLFLYAILPLIAIYAYYRLWRSLEQQSETGPFFWTLIVFLSSFAGLAATLFPYLIPTRLRIYEALAPLNTVVLMLAVVIFFVPIMIIYNWYMYRVFRGKAEDLPAYADDE